MKKLTSLFLLQFAFTVIIAQREHKATFMQPPEVYLEGIKKITVMDFEGSMGEKLSDYITANLITGGKAAVFSVVERTELQKVLNEQNISNSGLIDDNQAAKVGKILGIDAIITGSVSYSYKDEQRSGTWTDKDGNKHTTYCTKRTVNAEARMKIISVNTGQIIGNTVKTSAYSDDKCDEQRNSLASVESLAASCYDYLGSSLTFYFKPYYRSEVYKFEKIKDKEFKEKSKSAEDYLDNNNVDRAYSIYKSIYDIDPYNSAAACNIGYCYEMVGNYEKAFEYFNHAAEVDQITYEPMVNQAQNHITNNTLLERYGLTFEKKEFTLQSDALADKVTTRGNKSDKYNVRAGADETSEVLAKVPGDTEFTVIERNGDYTKIKLLGGKEGYINNDNVK
jgi:hypothetical protein